MDRPYNMDSLLPELARRLRRSNWLVVAVGLTLSMIIAVSVYAALRQELESKLTEQVNREVQNLKTQISITQNSILALAIYFTVENKINRSDFEKFTNELQRPSALRIMEYIKKVPFAQRELFESKIRQEGFPNFHIVHGDGSGDGPSSPTRNFYLPVVYVAPAIGNQSMRGFDMASQPIMLAAIRRAADTGSVTMTSGYLVPGSSNDTLVVNIFVPVGRASQSGFDNLRGLAGGVIDVSGLVATSTNYSAPIVAVTDTTGGKRKQLWSGTGFNLNDAVSRDIRLFDRTWRIFMLPPANKRPLLLGSLVLGLGSLVTLLIVAVSNQMELQAGTRLLGKRLDEQQANLQRSEATYRNLFYNAATANCELDATTGRFTRVNDLMCELTGFSERKLLSLTFRDVTHPDDRSKTDDDMKRLLTGEIEGFETEKRYLKENGETFWGLVSVRALRDDSGRARQLTKVIQDITDRKVADETKNILMRELAHRVRNNMQLVASLANRTAQSVRTVSDYQAQLLGRLRALSAAQDTLFEANWSSVKLARVVVKALAPFRSSTAKERWDILLPEISLNAQQAQTIALAVHELATNAMRFGALSRKGGAVSLHAELKQDLRRGSEQTLELSWVETGGPKVSKPKRTGFGSIMLEHLLAQQHGGTAKIDWLESGLQFHASLPLAGEEEK